MTQNIIFLNNTRSFVKSYISFAKYCIWNTGFIWLSLCLDDIHDQLQAITEKLQLQSATVKYKLQRNLVVSVEGGIVVDQSRPNTQLSDVFNKVFQCLICQALKTLAIYMAVSKCQVVAHVQKAGWSTTIPAFSVDGMRLLPIKLTSFSELLEKARQLYDL